MVRSLRVMCMCAGLVAVCAAPLWAQYPSEVVGFNGPPIDDPATSQEMFRRPGWTTTTSEHLDKLGECEGTGDACVTDGDCDFGAACEKLIGECSEAGTPCAYDRDCPAGESCEGEGNFVSNDAYRASGLQTEGAAAEEVFFAWAEDASEESWIRLTTYQGQVRPNPSLHTEGKVRFRMVNRSELFWGEIGLCLGVRETDVIAPQLHDGGTSGPIEWVGVDTTINGITAGEDGIVDTTADGDDIQEYAVGTDLVALDLPLGTAVISAGPNGTIDTIPSGDDQERFGYFIGANGQRVPIPAATFPPQVNPYTIEWDLSTGVVSVNGTPQGGGITGLTGDGDLNTPNSRGTLEHVAITYVGAGPERKIDFAIDELQFEAAEPDPILPPTVVWPIVAGDTEVTVTDLAASVDRVTLYRDGAELLVTTSGLPADEVVFTIDEAQAGEVYTATQRNGQSGVVSEPSAEVTVLPEPPAYTFAVLLDEGGTGSCDYGAGWEWVGATSAAGGASWAPQGQPVFTSDGVWQNIDIPLDDDDLVLSALGGDGQLMPSPSGFYTMDSLWFTLADATSNGPWEVFVDSIQLIDASGEVGATILDMEDGVNRLPFTRGQSPDELTASALTDAAAYEGFFSHRLEWTYDGAGLESVGVLQRVGSTCGTSALIDDTSTAIRFHMLCRGQPTNPGVPLPEIVAPIVAGDQDTIRILNDAGATSIQLYVNGEPAGIPLPPTGTATDFGGLSLLPGDSISATQDLGAGGVSDLAYPVAIQAAPGTPVVASPLLPGLAEVTVSGLYSAPYATASTVEVLINGSPAGNAAGGADTVAVSTTELQPYDVVTAVQTVNGATSAESAPVTVADSTIIREFELAPTLAGLSQALSADDLLNGQVGEVETGDVDPDNGVSAWNMQDGGCLEILYTEPSPGFHGATPPGGAADLTDGVPGSTVEAVLADYNRASLVIRYDLAEPTDITEIVVFAANEDPGAPFNGRLFQHYDVWVSQDNMVSFEPLIMTVTSGDFGYLNQNDDRATFTRVYDGVSGVLAEGVTNLRFVFYPVSNTAGRFQDAWQGNHNEDAGYQTGCPDTEPEDIDGFRKAFEAPIIKEIDVFGLRRGDYDGDGDVDLNDWANFTDCLTGPVNDAPLGAGCEVFDLAPRDGDVDAEDISEFQRIFDGGV